MAISIWYNSYRVLYSYLLPHILYIRELLSCNINSLVAQSGPELYICIPKHPIPVMEGSNGVVKERKAVSRVPHVVSKVQNNVWKVLHTVPRVQNIVSKIPHSVRRVQNSVSRVSNLVRRVHHSVSRIQSAVRRVPHTVWRVQINVLTFRSSFKTER